MDVSVSAVGSARRIVYRIAARQCRSLIAAPSARQGARIMCVTRRRWRRGELRAALRAPALCRTEPTHGVKHRARATSARHAASSMPARPRRCATYAANRAARGADMSVRRMQVHETTSLPQHEAARKLRLRVDACAISTCAGECEVAPWIWAAYVGCEKCVELLDSSAAPLLVHRDPPRGPCDSVMVQRSSYGSSSSSSRRALSPPGSGCGRSPPTSLPNLAGRHDATAAMQSIRSHDRPPGGRPFVSRFELLRVGAGPAPPALFGKAAERAWSGRATALRPLRRPPRYRGGERRRAAAAAAHHDCSIWSARTSRPSAARCHLGAPLRGLAGGR